MYAILMNAVMMRMIALNKKNTMPRLATFAYIDIFSTRLFKQHPTPNINNDTVPNTILAVVPTASYYEVCALFLILQKFFYSIFNPLKLIVIRNVADITEADGQKEDSSCVLLGFL